MDDSFDDLPPFLDMSMNSIYDSEVTDEMSAQISEAQLHGGAILDTNDPILYSPPVAFTSPLEDAIAIPNSTEFQQVPERQMPTHSRYSNRFQPYGPYYQHGFNQPQHHPNPSMDSQIPPHEMATVRSIRLPSIEQGPSGHRDVRNSFRAPVRLIRRVLSGIPGQRRGRGRGRGQGRGGVRGGRMGHQHDNNRVNDYARTYHFGRVYGPIILEMLQKIRNPTLLASIEEDLAEENITVVHEGEELNYESHENEEVIEVTAQDVERRRRIRRRSVQQHGIDEEADD